MDGLEEHHDPLAALRAGDHRSTTERIRDRLRPGPGRLRLAVESPDKRSPKALPWIIVLVALGAAYGIPRLTAASAPPIEQSIPLAPGDVDTPTVPKTTAPQTTVLEGMSAPIPITVHVAGAVRRPGLVHGDSSWRLADAIDAAGGAADGADLDRINLAAFLDDASRVYVPEVGELELPAVVGPERSAIAGAADGSKTLQSERVNINTADASRLETLPGIGPATAQAIIAHREQHGAFGTVQAIVAVRGIGPAKLEALSSSATV